MRLSSHARHATALGAEDIGAIGRHGVPGKNNDEVFALVFHHLQENLDSFLPVVTFVFLPVEVIGFVYEKNAPIARLRTSLVLGAVWQIYRPTTSSRVTARCPSHT